MKIKTIRWLTLSLVATVLVVQFTNCSNFAENAAYSSTAASVVCDNPDCITPSLDNLSIKANTGTSAEYGVPADLLEFNLGGDCNEGGYPYNTVRWELYQNGVKVRDSGMVGTGGNGVTANSRCINGRFLLYVLLSPVTEDPISRQGLRTGQGVRGPYDLWIEVFGQTAANSAPQRNMLKGRSRVSLIPLN